MGYSIASTSQLVLGLAMLWRDHVARAMVKDETFPSWVFVQMLKTYWLSVDPVVES